MKLIIFSISLILLTSIASADQVIQPPQTDPSSPIYSIKLFIEDIQESLTFNTQAKILLMKQHLDQRMNDLQYTSIMGNDQVPYLLQKIQIKRIELDSELENLKPCLECDFTDPNSTESQFYSYMKRHNGEILNGFLTNPSMPEQSRMGIQNALNKSGFKITANMVQGTYSSGYTSLLPFKFAKVYDPIDNVPYSIIIRGNNIEITSKLYSNYDTILHPTAQQMNELNNIVKKVGKKGLTMSDKIRLTRLWFSIQKE